MPDAEVGTCSTCGQELIRHNGAVWHPWNVKEPCDDGGRTGLHPPASNFVPKEN